MINLLPTSPILALDSRHSFILGFFTVNLSLAGPDIGVVRLDQLGLLPDLPARKGHDVQRDAEVRGDEGLVVEVAVLGVVVDEDAEAAREGDQHTEEEGHAGPDYAEWGFVGEGLLVDALCAARADEEDVGD